VICHRAREIIHALGERQAGDGAGSEAEVLEECAYRERIPPTRQPGGLPIRVEMDEGMPMSRPARVEVAVERVGGAHAPGVGCLGIIALDRPRAEAGVFAPRTAIVPANRGPAVAFGGAAVIGRVREDRGRARGVGRGSGDTILGRGVRDLDRPTQDRTEGDDGNRERDRQGSSHADSRGWYYTGGQPIAYPIRRPNQSGCWIAPPTTPHRWLTSSRCPPKPKEPGEVHRPVSN
jgi:hypothetical protein